MSAQSVCNKNKAAPRSLGLVSIGKCDTVVMDDISRCARQYRRLAAYGGPERAIEIASRPRQQQLLRHCDLKSPRSIVDTIIAAEERWL